MTASSQYSVVLGARVVSAILTALSLVLLARASGPEQFGWFAALLGVVSVVINLGDLGHQTLAIRLHARTENDSASMAAMSIQRLLTLGITFALSIAFGAFVVAGILPQWCFILLVWQWLEKEVHGGLGIALAEKRAFQQLLVLASERSLGLVCFLLGLIFFPAIHAFLLGMVLGASLGLVLVYRANPRYPLKPACGLAHVDRIKSRHYWWASASAQVRNIDATLLSLVSVPIEVGYYSLPSRAAGPLKIAASAMSTVALPAASRGDMHELRSLAKTMRWITGLCLVALLGLGLFAEIVIVNTVGDQFLGSVTPLRILLVGLAFNIPGSFLSGILQGSGSERQVGRLGIMLGLLTVALVVIGGAVYGSIGAAVGVSLVYFLQFVVVVIVYWSKR